MAASDVIFSRDMDNPRRVVSHARDKLTYPGAAWEDTVSTP
jgi:hypothetical protein